MTSDLGINVFRIRDIRFQNELSSNLKIVDSALWPNLLFVLKGDFFTIPTAGLQQPGSPTSFSPLITIIGRNKSGNNIATKVSRYSHSA